MFNPHAHLDLSQVTYGPTCEPTCGPLATGDLPSGIIAHHGWLSALVPRPGALVAALVVFALTVGLLALMQRRSA